MKELKLNKKVLIELSKAKMSQGAGANNGINDDAGFATVGARCYGSVGCTVGCPKETEQCLTKGKCDIYSFGHDDGPNCLSKTDYLCWCKGI